MALYVFDAVDALFFRDGRPYRMAGGDGDPGNDQADVETIFPPSPYTIVGALRAGFARERGWDGTGSWGKDFKSTLGDGSRLGKLSFRGPFLARKTSGEDLEILYRLPANVVGRHDENGRQQLALLGLYDEDVTRCDIGDVRLPNLPGSVRGEAGWKPLADAFVTRVGLQQILNGAVPDARCVVHAEALFETEARLGLQRSGETHVVSDEGALYSPTFVRLHRGVRLVMQLDGVPEDWRAPTLVPLGGEGRMAAIDACSVSPIDASNVPKNTGCTSADEIAFTFIALTPLRLPTTDQGPVRTLPGDDFFEAFGHKVTIVSACVDRPEYIGGWDSLHSCPLPAHPHLRAGSVLFCQAKPDALDALVESSKTGLTGGDPDASFGINQFAIGGFPLSSENQQEGTPQ